MRCNSMKNRSRFTWIINNRRCDARSTVALSVNCDCKQTVTGPHPAPLHNNAEESRAELSQKRRPEAFCTCFIWHSQITHKHTRARTHKTEIYCSCWVSASPWLLLCYVVWQMTLTLTAGQTGAGVDGCMSGALNCVRAGERAEFVTVSDYKSSGGRAEGAPEGPTQDVSFDWCRWQK